MTEHEIFQFLAYKWDVTKAIEVAAELPVHSLDPEPWFALLPLIRIDEAHLPHVDLSRPLIAVQIEEADGHAMLIDGWHRLARARRDGTATLPVVLLDPDQERSVRIFGGAKAPAPPGQRQDRRPGRPPAPSAGRVR